MPCSSACPVSALALLQPASDRFISNGSGHSCFVGLVLRRMLQRATSMSLEETDSMPSAHQQATGILQGA